MVMVCQFIALSSYGETQKTPIYLLKYIHSPALCSTDVGCHFHKTNEINKLNVKMRAVCIVSTHVKLNCAAARVGCACHASSS